MSVLQVHPSIYRIGSPYEGGGMVFLYLLKGERVVLVDTGTANAPAQTLPAALAEIGLDLSDVDLILNTHAHLDHMGGNVRVKGASAALVHLHGADLPLARSVEAEIEYHAAPLRALGVPPALVQQRSNFVLAGAGTEKAEVDVILSDGDVVDLGSGVELRAIHTPGHTPGSMAFYWEREGVLITGDAIQGYSVRPGGYPYYFDAFGYRRSLEALARLDLRLLCLGHAFLGRGVINDPTRVGAEAGAFIRGSIDTADTIHAAVAEAVRRLPGASPREIALGALSELIYHIPQLLVRGSDLPNNAAPTLLAHMEAVLAGGYPG